MRLEMLQQFLVPLIFIAIWALTHLLNRGAQPLPPRPGTGRPLQARPPQGRSGGMAPQRSDSSPASTNPMTRTVSTGQSEMPSAWPDFRDTATLQNSSRRPQPPASGSSIDDSIVFLDQKPPSQRARPIQPLNNPSRSGNRSAQGRKAGKGRQNPGNRGAQGRGETETHRALSEQVGESLARQRSKPLGMSPLQTSPLAPLSEQSSATHINQHRAKGTSRPPTLSGEQVRELLNSPTKLREVILLNEILQPPLSMRPGRHGGFSRGNPIG